MTALRLGEYDVDMFTYSCNAQCHRTCCLCNCAMSGQKLRECTPATVPVLHKVNTPAQRAAATMFFWQVAT